MRVEIIYGVGCREYIIQGEVNKDTGEVDLLDAWDLDDGRSGFDILDRIEASPRDLTYVQGLLRTMAGVDQ